MLNLMAKRMAGSNTTLEEGQTRLKTKGMNGRSKTAGISKVSAANTILIGTSFNNKTMAKDINGKRMDKTLKENTTA